MEFFTDKDEQPSPTIPEPSDTAVFETREFLCILNIPQFISLHFDILQETAGLFQDRGCEQSSDRITVVERL